MTSNKTIISDAELALFRDAVKGTRRLKNDRVLIDQAKPVVRRTQSDTDDWQPSGSAGPMLSDPAFPEDLEPQEHLSYEVSGIQRTTLRKLKRGQLPIYAELDLHGKTIEQARQLMQQLLDLPRPSGQCVRIVHGRGLSSPDGRPILKTRVAYWLQQHPDVLAFCSAQPLHGGTGAVYVLLKK